MAAGLRDVPSTARDVFHYLSASELTQVRKLRTPAALPKIFAAARLGLPGALAGVLVPSTWPPARASASSCPTRRRCRSTRSSGPLS